MITKTFFNRCLLLMGALFIAASANADSYFFFDDPVFMPDDYGKTVTLPVKAHFDKAVSTWDVEFTYPDGLTPISVSLGSDLSFKYIDPRGREKTWTTTVAYNNEMTHFVGTNSNFRTYDDEGDFDPAGLLKWEAGTYDEMLLITFRVDYYFEEGIHVITKTSCSYDNNPSSGIIPDPSVTGFVIESDVNLDGTVSMADVTELANYLATGILYKGAPKSEEEPGLRGDLNHDWVVDITDLNELCDFICCYEWYIGYELNEASTTSTITIIDNAPNYLSFYIDPIEIRPVDLGNDITVPVRALFEGYTSAWDVQLVFAPGLTPVGVAPGRDMAITYYDNRGREQTSQAMYQTNSDFTHFVAASSGINYQLNDEDEYELCGTAKWAPGEYDEMFVLTLHVDENFSDGECISITSKSVCGVDTRLEYPVFTQMPIPYDQYDLVPGDVNVDGTITLADLSAFLDYLADNQNNWFNTNSAELHIDGRIDLLDMEKLHDFILFGEWYEGYVLNEGEDTNAFAYVNYPPIEPGDLNGDGRLSINDVTTLINLLLSSDNIDNPAADVDGNGVVNITDVTALINAILTSPN